PQGVPCTGFGESEQAQVQGTNRECPHGDQQWPGAGRIVLGAVVGGDHHLLHGQGASMRTGTHELAGQDLGGAQHQYLGRAQGGGVVGGGQTITHLLQRSAGGSVGRAHPYSAMPQKFSDGQEGSTTAEPGAGSDLQHRQRMRTGAFEVVHEPPKGGRQAVQFRSLQGHTGGSESLDEGMFSNHGEQRVLRNVRRRGEGHHQPPFPAADSATAGRINPTSLGTNVATRSVNKDKAWAVMLTLSWSVRQPAHTTSLMGSKTRAPSE